MYVLLMSQEVQQMITQHCNVDCSQVPYRVVAKYRNNNEVKPFVFPNIIHQVCTGYNKAHVLVEVNDLGQQISDTLQYETEYENLLMTTQRGH